MATLFLSNSILGTSPLSHLVFLNVQLLVFVVFGWSYIYDVSETKDMFNPNMESKVIWITPINKWVNWDFEKIKRLIQGWWYRLFVFWGYYQPSLHLHESRTCCISLPPGVLYSSPGLYCILFVLSQTSLALTDFCSDFTAVRSLWGWCLHFWKLLILTLPSRDQSLKTKPWQTLVVLSPIPAILLTMNLAAPPQPQG